jgi:hypothetical protein
LSERLFDFVLGIKKGKNASHLVINFELWKCDLILDDLCIMKYIYFGLYIPLKKNKLSFHRWRLPAVRQMGFRGWRFKYATSRPAK